MSGEVPEIYWYLFWVGALAFLFIFTLSLMTVLHRGHMKTLELLKLYLEKGIEPPPALAEMLAKSSGEADRKWRSTPRGARLQSFIGFLFTACVAGGITWWRIEEGGPQAAIYIAGALTAFWGVGALGFLIAAIVAPER